MRAKVRDQAARWRKPDVIRQRYLRLCERLHMPSKLYELNFEQSGEALSMSFRKDAVFVGRKQSMFGKNIIITDNSTAQDIMDDMRHLHDVLTLTKGTRKPSRRLETPSKTQAEVLSAFGYYVDKSGVLQPSTP
jgi:hypothetical protein